MSTTTTSPKVGVEKHFTSSILLWMRTDQPRQKGMDHWKGPHSGIITASPGLEEYRQLHLAEANPGLWPPTQGVETRIPADRMAARSGVVVNVASILAWIALGGTYSVSKAALSSATDSMRLELGPRGVQVVGVYMGYVDTDMTSGVEAPKIAPADVVRQVLDGIVAGAMEVLADDMTRAVRGGLAQPVDERYAAFLPHAV